jgi:hypothetical protein
MRKKALLILAELFFLTASGCKGDRRRSNGGAATETAGVTQPAAPTPTAAIQFTPTPSLTARRQPTLTPTPLPSYAAVPMNMATVTAGPTSTPSREGKEKEEEDDGSDGSDVWDDDDFNGDG